MRRISFYKNNRSNNKLHIETEGCIVNITVNLRDFTGREVTSVEIITDKTGEKWDLDGATNNRIIKRRPIL